MSPNALRLHVCLSHMHPDVREAFLNVLEFMATRGQRLQPEQIVALVNIEFADIFIDRMVSSVDSNA